jgi:hypothetical protein
MSPLSRRAFLAAASAAACCRRPSSASHRSEAGRCGSSIGDLLTKIGEVDLQAVDWSTLLTRRARKEPPSAGGWNIFCTNWISSDDMTPAVGRPLERVDGRLG